MSLVANPQTEIRHPQTMALAVLTAVAVVLLLQYAQAVIIPIVLGVLISYALDPAVTAMARWRIPRTVSAAALLFLLVSAGGGLLYSLRGEAAAILEQLPQGARHLRQMLESDRDAAPGPIEQVQKAASELEKAATPPPVPSGVQRVRLEMPPFDVTEYLWWGSLGVAAAAGQLVLIVFLAFFLLASGDLYRRKLVKIAPSFARKRITLEILADIDRQIETFVIVQVFTSTIVGVATWIALRWLGLQQAAMWGLLAGVFNSVPYLGPLAITGGTGIVAFLQFSSIRLAVIVGLVTLAITSLEGLLLLPALMSRAARMNAVAVFVGLLFWGWVWNVWGMLLAVPMLMVIKAVCDHIDDLKPIGELLGE